MEALWSCIQSLRSQPGTGGARARSTLPEWGQELAVDIFSTPVSLWEVRYKFEGASARDWPLLAWQADSLWTFSLWTFPEGAPCASAKLTPSSSSSSS